MARTYLSGDNSRGTEVTAAGGSYAHFRGWNAGVQVSATRDSETESDLFFVSMTGGSHAARGDVLLGTVKDTPDGPVWEPAHTRKDADTVVIDGETYVRKPF